MNFYKLNTYQPTPIRENGVHSSLESAYKHALHLTANEHLFFRLIISKDDNDQYIISHLTPYEIEHKEQPYNHIVTVKSWSVDATRDYLTQMGFIEEDATLEDIINVLWSLYNGDLDY